MTNILLTMVFFKHHCSKICFLSYSPYYIECASHARTTKIGHLSKLTIDDNESNRIESIGSDETACFITHDDFTVM